MNYKYVSDEVLEYLNKMVFELKNFSVEGNYPGKHRSLLTGKSLEFVQHREYSQGDDIKLIDWKVYARKEKFFVKQYQQETNLVAYLFLDCSSSMWYPKGRITKYEYGSFLVSYISYVLLHQGDTVNVIRFDSVIKDSLEALSQRNFYSQILEFLENEIVGEKTNYDCFFDFVVNYVKKRSLVFLITDLVSEKYTKIVNMLKQISAYGISLIVLHIVDKSEMLLDLNYEKSVVEDVEDKSLSVTTDVQEIKELYQKEFEELVSFYEQSLNTNNISYYFIDTSLPIIQNLEIVLGQK
jgi:uncharacterized protein (DUF58 family)